MPQSQSNSALREYMQNYGQRLQSLLIDPADSAPVTDASSALGHEPASTAPAAPGAATTPMQAAAPAPGMVQHEQSMLEGGARPQTQQQGTSFAELWQQIPTKERTREVDKLEQTLAKGNETIDSAYDDMIKKLGTRPSGTLSREDKGMLLMEFGLSLMANSSREAYGEDLGGAVGASGLQTLSRYQQLTRGRQQQYDRQVGAIESARSKSKSALAEKGTIEGIKSAGALERSQLESGRISGHVTTEGGDVYGYNRRGEASAMLDPETNEPLKARQPGEPLVPVLEEDGTEVWVPQSEAAGRKKRPPGSGTSALSGLKASDSNTLYRQAAGLFGGLFDPITGRISGLSREQTQMVQQIAARAGELYLSGEKNHAKAINQAFGEIRSGGAPSELEEGPGEDLPRPTSKAELDALPPRTQFIAPDGSKRIKP